MASGAPKNPSADRPGPLEAILRWVPGFSGYIRQEERRQADAKQREWIVDRLERGKQGLERYARALVDATQLDALTPVDRLRGRVDALCARIRGAMRGGGGFFDAAAVDEAQLERVYQHDLALVEQVAAVADAMESLGESPTGASETLTAISQQLIELSDAWDAREDLLRE